MALYHDATLSPSKPELLSAWVPTQPWCPRPDAAIELIGAFRFDDPEGQVGLETHIVRSGETVLNVPLTYRAEPLAAAEDALVCEMHHSALGTRWVYDGLCDQRMVLMLAGAAMTGQGEALGMVQYDGVWHIAPGTVRISGGGWSGGRVSVDGLVQKSDDPLHAVYQNDQFTLSVHRHLAPGNQPTIGLSASWADSPGSVVLAEVSER